MAKITLSTLEFQPSFLKEIGLEVANVQIDGRDRGRWAFSCDDGIGEPIDDIVEKIKSSPFGPGFSVDTDDILRLARTVHISLGGCQGMGAVSWMAQKQRGTGKGYWHIRINQPRDDSTLIHEFVHIAARLAINKKYKYVRTKTASRIEVDEEVYPFERLNPYHGETEYSAQHKQLAVLTSAILTVYPDIVKDIERESIQAWVNRLKRFEPGLLDPTKLEAWRRYIGRELGNCRGQIRIADYQSNTLEEESNERSKYYAGTLDGNQFEHTRGGLLYHYYFFERLMSELEKMKEKGVELK